MPGASVEICTTLKRRVTRIAPQPAACMWPTAIASRYQKSNKICIILPLICRKMASYLIILPKVFLSVNLFCIHLCILLWNIYRAFFCARKNRKALRRWARLTAGKKHVSPSSLYHAAGRLTAAARAPLFHPLWLIGSAVWAIVIRNGKRPAFCRAGGKRGPDGRRSGSTDDGSCCGADMEKRQVYDLPASGG